ncbi:DEKNAAC101674 [Brettanomyces naardenensis]|uniref:DEKNAAC101674 n=1 Tax=Brettanomyces naardenensis TaxID=13370 RepID=A0A448YIU4_BRENA|nr:DEKNAAC101674 [Brettanomyces naardenensis]
MSDAEDVTSKDILRGYLQKELYQLITKSQFHTLLNKVTHRTVDKAMADELFALLNEQKDRNINRLVEDNIESVKLVGIYDDDKEKSNGISDDELSKLVGSLLLLDKSVQEEVRKLEDECNEEMKNISETISNLDRLDFATSNSDDSIEKLEKLLKSIESQLLS